MRIMAIDYGDARTGVAVSDPTGLLAGYTTVIQSRKPDLVATEVARLAGEYGVEELVMGFPRNMDGTEGPRRSAIAALPSDSGKQRGWSRCCGMSGGPPSRPTISSIQRGKK